MLVSTARVFLLIPPHVVFDFPSLPASASQGWISYFGVAGVRSVPDQRTWVDGYFPGARVDMGGFFMP